MIFFSDYSKRYRDGMIINYVWKYVDFRWSQKLKSIFEFFSDINNYHGEKTIQIWPFGPFFQFWFSSKHHFLPIDTHWRLYDYFEFWSFVNCLLLLSMRCRHWQDIVETSRSQLSLTRRCSSLIDSTKIKSPTFLIESISSCRLQCWFPS